MLHVVTSDVPGERGSFPAPRIVDQEHYEWSAWQDEFCMRFSQCPEGGRHRVCVRVGDPARTIVAEAQADDAELIVLSWRGSFADGHGAVSGASRHGAVPAAHRARRVDRPSCDHRSDRLRRELRRARLRRQRLLALAVLGAALALVVVLLFAVGPLASHLGRPGKPPLGYFEEARGRAPLPGDRMDARQRGVAQRGRQRPGRRRGRLRLVPRAGERQRPADDENLNLVAAARGHDLNIFATVD